MKNILFIESSPRGSDSYSHQAARSIVNELQTRNPGSGIVVRDLGQNPPPHAGMAFGKRNRQFLIHNSRRDFAMKTLFETKSRTEATNAFRLPDDTHVCCVHLRTPDLARALDFYQRVIGFKLIERGESKASLSATGLAPTLLVFSEDRCASRRPEHTTGLYHFAIRYPTRRDLAQPGGPRSALNLVKFD